MLPSFEEYFSAATGKTAFAWQARLAEELVSGAWPRTIALPTASGKTSLVEIWAYALAKNMAAREASRRTVPLRLVWVVDRRIVVDEVAVRARRLACVLQKARADARHPLATVAESLSQQEVSSPLTVAELRGGLVGQLPWARAPHQPMVLATTVDQVGSRLLFRGYGVSPYQLSMEAGLLACDCLVVVDEAHLSQPFVMTLERIRNLQGTAQQSVALPVRTMVVSATLPRGGSAEPFTLRPEERTELTPRLARPKWASLQDASGTMSLDRHLAESARQLIESRGGVVAVVVNRVDTARDTFARLQNDYHALLLTGRARPYDRQVVLDEWMPYLRAGRDRTQEQVPRVVVATQTVEVGADFDFDGLVTEVAPLSALRQRFGRLNRLGEQAEAFAVIARRGKEDGVYPHDVLEAVWTWLCGHVSIQQQGKARQLDMSDEALGRCFDASEHALEVPVTDAPFLTRAHLDQWAQTSPIPDLDPDVAPFLHGKEPSNPADVQVIWRADLEERDLAQAVSSAQSSLALLERRWAEQICLAPPRLEETVALPIWIVRRWLERSRPDIASGDDESAGGAGAMGDVEGALPAAEATARRARKHREVAIESRAVLCWDGQRAGVRAPNQIAPGDTIIVPATYGGLDIFGWDPQSSEPVRDVGDLAGRMGRRRQRLRLHPGLLPSLLQEQVEQDQRDELSMKLQSLLGEWTAERDRGHAAGRGVLQEGLQELVGQLFLLARDDVQVLLRGWLACAMRSWIPYPVTGSPAGGSPTGVVLEWVEAPASPDTSLSMPADLADGVEREALMDAADESSMIGVGRTVASAQVTLDVHSDEVAGCAECWAKACELPSQIVRTLYWAGQFHDIGKGEERFQLMLHGGDPARAAAATQVLAKSGMDPHDRALQEHARRAARWPAGLRHEAISARLLLDAYDRLPAETDRELLCYLVGTHHGRGRPWFSIGEDVEPTEITVSRAGYEFVGPSETGLERADAGWLDLFAGLQRRYGAWGLAYLEAALRLADHRVSEREARA